MLILSWELFSAVKWCISLGQRKDPSAVFKHAGEEQTIGTKVASAATLKRVKMECVVLFLMLRILIILKNRMF